jgi:hypothetical protein
MDTAKRNAQFEAAFDRVIEAQLLMEGIAVHTADSHAMDIQARLNKIVTEMFQFKGNIALGRK